MKTNKFWNWASNQTSETTERILFLNGTIAEDSWFDDEVTPQLFKDELEAGEGDITVWINSPGGDCFAAAQIYNMLVSYKGKVTVKIDGIAASAASVIAMAGSKVLMSPVSMMMIHNPATVAWGDHKEFQRAIDMLEEVKESIINSYAIKTGLSRSKLSHLMDSETWMNANKAMELGFVDDVFTRENEELENHQNELNNSLMFSRKAVDNSFVNKVTAKYKKPSNPKPIDSNSNKVGHSVDDIMERLNTIKKFM